jgi:hypothetical protein
MDLLKTSFCNALRFGTLLIFDNNFLISGENVFPMFRLREYSLVSFEYVFSYTGLSSPLAVDDLFLCFF